MNIKKIDQEIWADGIAKLKQAYQLTAPQTDGQKYAFKPLSDDQMPDLSGLNTDLSPKSLVYPQSQTMFSYTTDQNKADHHIMQEVLPDDAPKAVIGIRPCDALAFLLVKRNFDTPEHKDPYWINAYEAYTLVGHACVNPCSACFCTTAGSGPFDEQGLDLLLMDDADGYLVKTLTEKGEALVKAAGWDQAPDADDTDEEIAKLKEAAEAKISSEVNTKNLKDLVTTELYDAPFWEEVAFSCINCGTCTFVCPTCWCFDIQDENCGSDGLRMRNWDSCMFPLFTLHGTGHNPRGTKIHRVRQRFMHKLKYYVDKYEDGIQCVGCGRCVRLCPVNIDIRQVCQQINDFKAAEASS